MLSKLLANANNPLIDFFYSSLSHHALLSMTGLPKVDRAKHQCGLGAARAGIRNPVALRGSRAAARPNLVNVRSGPKATY